LVLAVGLGLEGCSQDQGFSRQAYCAALAANPGLDTKKLVDGDPAELAKASEAYTELQELAPPQLSEDWALVVAGLEAMLVAAGGGQPVDHSDQADFSAALGAIDKDRLERCPE